MSGHSEPAGGQPLLTREILVLAAVFTALSRTCLGRG